MAGAIEVGAKAVRPVLNDALAAARENAARQAGKAKASVLGHATVSAVDPTSVSVKVVNGVNSFTGEKVDSVVYRFTNNTVNATYNAKTGSGTATVTGSTTILHITYLNGHEASSYATYGRITAF